MCKFLWLYFVCLSVSLSLKVRKSKNLVIINCKCVCKCKYESNFDCGCKIVCLFVFTSIWLILFMSFYITQFPICISLCVSSKPSLTIILFARHCVSMIVFAIKTKKWAIAKSYDEFSLFICSCIHIHVFLGLLICNNVCINVHVLINICIHWCLYIYIHMYFWIYVHAYVFMYLCIPTYAYIHICLFT